MSSCLHPTQVNVGLLDSTQGFKDVLQSLIVSLQETLLQLLPTFSTALLQAFCHKSSTQIWKNEPCVQAFMELWLSKQIQSTEMLTQRENTYFKITILCDLRYFSLPLGDQFFLSDVHGARLLKLRLICGYLKRWLKLCQYFTFVH